MNRDNQRPSVLMVDGYSLIFRGFHALPLLSSGGAYTNAVQGFFGMLFKALADIRPDSLCVMMDMHAPTFRHTLFEEYKATRKPMPEELRPQIPLVRELLVAMGISIVEMEGYEADDLLGTAARLAQEQGRSTYILTGDRDSLQLVGGDVRVILTKTGITESLLLDADKVLEIYGFTPAQVPDMKGLMGDSSDNIPGIAGIGEKTALKLIREYGTLEEILDHADQVKGKLGEKLKEGRQIALLSRELGTICTTAPLELDFDSCGWGRLLEALPLMQRYQLNRLSQSLKSLMGQGEKKTAEAKEQPPVPESGPEPAPLSTAEVRPFPSLRDQGVLRSMEEVVRTVEEAGGYCDQTQSAMALHLGQEEATLCLGDGRCWHIPLMMDLTMGGLYEDQLLTTLGPAVEKAPLIVHGAKALFGKMARYGYPLPPIRQDTMMGAYLLHPGQKGFSLEASLEEEYGMPPKAATAYDLYALALRQEAALREKNMLDLLLTIEQPLTLVLFEMEREGFGIDVDTLDELGAQFTGEIESLKADVYHLTGVSDFNLNSPKQLGEVLFDKLGLPAGKKSKTGAYSTDVTVLEGLAELHPAIEPLLRYRKLSKLQSTYIEGLRKLTDRTGRVHTTFDQTGAVTGRISSQEPNLQNIPIRSEEGREIRKAFVAREGYVLLDADYSQIELRVLAHLSGDAAMRDAFIKGQDIHTRTAAEIYGIPLEEVDAQMRRRAKAVNFGIVYGISGFGLARNTGISRREADAFIATYFERYPGVHAFMERMVKLGYGRGYAETLFRRRRDLPELVSSNRNVRAFGERAAMNTPVQGTAADIIKMAMVRVREQLVSGGYQARLILQVHDELVVECPADEIQPVSRLIQEAMEGVAKLSVPLVAEVSAGKNWFEAH
ncbi:MAG: DNA polymerase I [Clostridiales bacterium]|nr:DNA polymerase I [Clostridiales bacterium]